MSVNTISKLKPGNPRPSIVFSLGFEYNWQIGGYDYLEYMERPEAFNPAYHLNDEYNPKNRYKGGDFLSYMSNEEKSDGLFDNEKDRLTQTDKEKYRHLERVSRDEGCPKYFGVVSFDNEFLLEHGILTRRSDGQYNLDAKKLKELGRLGINKMISENSKFDVDNIYWNAAIHTNTDNIHIHYSLCEYHRKEDRKITQKGNKQDCIDVKAFNALKSAIANRIIGNEHVKQLTALRDVIRKGVKAFGPKEQLLELLTQLPENVLKSSKQKCGYNSGYVKRYRPLIDSITDSAIRSDFELYKMGKLFSEMTEKSQLLYKQTYGVGNQALYKNFRKNKMNDLKERCGNEVLNAVREIYQEQLMHPFNASVLQEHPSEDGMSGRRAFAEQSEDVQAHPSEEDLKTGLLAEQSEPAQEHPPEEVYYEPPFPGEEQLPDEYYASLYSSEPEIHPSEDGLETGLLAEQSEPVLNHPSEEPVFISWSKEYKEALNYLYGNDADPNNIIKSDPEKALELLFSECNKGNMLAAYDIGKIYAGGLAEAADGKALGEQYYTKALNGFKQILDQDTKLLENLSLDSNEKELKKKRWECVYLHYRIGKMYDRGLGTEQDYSEAKKHYEQAKNNKYAEFSLGNMYKYGNGVDIDHVKAAEYVRLSADKGMPYASYNLGNAYENGLGVEKDKNMSDKYYSKALQGFKAIYRDNKDENVCYRIGLIYLAGKGTAIDPDKAEKYLTEAADAKNLNAQCALGKLYQSEQKKDLDKAEHYLMLAADQDDEHGLGNYALGKLYLTEEKYDLDKAEEHLLLSAEKNNMYAQYALGKLYQSDDKKDLDKAEQYLMLAAKQDDELGLSHYALGKLYLTEEKYDPDKAEEHLLLSAEKDNMYAQYALGKLYQSDDKKDLDKAEQYLMLAAKQDDELGLSHYALGKLYLTEEKYDPDKAEEHLLLSAEKDNMYAQYALGKLYLTPEKYSWEKAEAMLLKAAQQNNQYAQVRLGVEYFKRHEFEKGREQLKKASEQGNEFAAEYLSRPLRLPNGYTERKKQLAVYINPAFARLLNEMQRHTVQLINEYEYEEDLQLMQNRNY